MSNLNNLKLKIAKLKYEASLTHDPMLRGGMYQEIDNLEKKIESLKCSG